MTRRRAAFIAWSVWSLTMLLCAGALLLHALTRDARIDVGFGFRGFAVLFAIPAATLGALIASRRPENPIGWIILCITGLSSGIQALGGEYGEFTLVAHRAVLPGALFAAWLQNWIWIPGAGSVATVLLVLFPTGKVPSPKWRPVLWFDIAALVNISIGSALYPGKMENFPAAQNPYGIGGPIVALMATGGYLLLTIACIASIASLFARFRTARGEERQQLRTIAAAGALLVFVLLPSFASTPLTNPSGAGAMPKGISYAVIAAFFLFLVTLGLAVLKYRLSDVDIVISKTVVFGILAAFITVVYVGIVVGIGAILGRGDRPNTALSIVATAVVAILFQPVRLRVRRLANRLVYGERATPYEVVADFSHRMAGTIGADRLLPQMAEAAAAGVGASRARVTLALPEGGARVFSWPADADGDDYDRVLAVEDGGEQVGELAVAKPRGEPLTPAEDSLLEDLASQAGLALRNVRLTAELQARLEEISEQADEIRRSRQRIVAARDAALRQLERDIHGGTQQQLLAITAELRAATDLVGRDPDAARDKLDDLGEATNNALEALRDLARGIFPPLLADKGLVAALEAHINKVGLHSEVRADPVFGRLDPATENAVYFCCVEAMQNAAKYAPGAAVAITLSASHDAVSFTVADEGSGFDPDAVRHRAGLQNMADRVEALGGALEVRSSPGAGTTVSGRIPSRTRELAS